MAEKTLKILFIGDIVGKPGRRAAKLMIPLLQASEKVNLVIANGENLASGKGMTFGKYEEMIESGIDYFTSGNHIWNNQDIVDHLGDPSLRVLRPENYPDNMPGSGVREIEDGLVLVNLQGRVFMDEELADPFKIGRDIAEKYADKIIIIDFHAEATSEKVALGFYLDGKVSAIIGTHTHIQTADERVLPDGTAYISDVGMTGPQDSVLGVKKEIIIEKFLTQLPKSHKVASGEMILNAVIIEIDKKTKKALNIKRVSKVIKP
ncbi:MAG: TIGR00282 family metallophosphoesterase [Patescibacteria group bacterium]